MMYVVVGLQMMSWRYLLSSRKLYFIVYLLMLRPVDTGCVEHLGVKNRTMQVPRFNKDLLSLFFPSLEITLPLKRPRLRFISILRAEIKSQTGHFLYHEDWDNVEVVWGTDGRG